MDFLQNLQFKWTYAPHRYMQAHILSRQSTMAKINYGFIVRSLDKLHYKLVVITLMCRKKISRAIS